MSNEVDLLRMLEPAVRPGGVPGGVQHPRVPIEARSFDSLLEEAHHVNESATGRQEKGVWEADGIPVKAKQVGLMGQLAQFGQIENGSLRHLLENATATRSSSGTTGSKMNKPSNRELI